MKTGNLLVILALLLVAFGSMLSYFGYGESLQPVTVTSTEFFTTTSTKTIPSAETLVTTVTTASPIFSDVADIQGIGSGAKYCGRYRSYRVTLNAGEIRISYSSTGGSLDFWMLTEAEWNDWKAKSTCADLKSAKATAKKFGSTSYEFAIDVPSSGDYYLVWLNVHSDTVRLDVNVGTGLQEFTVTTERTLYSTEDTSFVTHSVTVSSEPAGLGVLFFSGIGLVAIGAISAALSRTRKTLGVTPPPAQPPSSTTAGPSPVQGPGKFCMNCGAPLPADSKFCTKCGSKQ